MNTAAQQTTPLLKTPLHALHVAMGGKMVPFAGYDMPVQYDGFGVMKEHLHTRQHTGLFDVSHMGQAVLTGDVNALEKIVPSDIAGLKINHMRYTVLLNADGGIVDDMIVTRWDENTLFLVVNAACKDKDFAYIRQSLGTAAQLAVLDDHALIAVQGPKAESAVAAHFPFAAALPFMTTAKNDAGDIFVSRCGYTGEDGFEISLPATIAEEFTRRLLDNPDVRLIGLGARDSLRLEAGLCLYGHDIDDTKTPVDANLKWVIQKRRREAADFAGAAKIMAQINDGTAQTRVGIKPDGRAPMREGTELFSTDGKKIGVITSGGFGPTVDAPVAMGYVDTSFAATGTVIEAQLRGTARPVTVCDLPFTPHRYKKG
jgi:aminomethyltransferase